MADARGSLDVDAEAGDLRKVGRAGEIEDMHVLEHLISVEATEYEETTVGEARGVVSACTGALAGGLPRLVLQRD